MVGFALAFTGTLIVLVVAGMLCFGQQVLEWIEGEPG